MAAAEVTVQRLRLRSQSAAPGLQANVEDALRVSSKPAALLNRFVLVRRLRLRATAGASAQALALQLERAWQQLAARAQPLEQAGDSAEAVWSASLSVARQALLRRWLRGEATEAWFWQRLLPPDADGPWPQLAAALMLAADEEAVSMAFVAEARRQTLQLQALLALIAEHRKTASFVEAISDSQAAAILDRIESQHEAGLSTHRHLHAASPAAHAKPPRARLLVRMAAISKSPEQDMRIERHPAPLSQLLQEPPRPADQASNLDRPAVAALNVKLATAAPASQPRAASPAADVALAQGLASPWSGLWLLLPLLQRHGLDDADDPPAAWAGAMRSACRCFGIPDDDPVHTALDSLDPLAAPDLHWLRIARLAAVHDARLPLLRIARRAGAAWISAERIDVEFPPAALDLRIRRAGFDINPGFVPWLGRIVHFHYPS